MNRNDSSNSQSECIETKTEHPEVPTETEYQQIDGTDWRFKCEAGIYHYNDEAKRKPVSSVFIKQNDEKFIITIRFRKETSSKVINNFFEKFEYNPGLQKTHIKFVKKEDNQVELKIEPVSSCSNPPLIPNTIFLNCIKIMDALSVYCGDEVKKHMLFHGVLQKQIVERHFILPNKLIEKKKLKLDMNIFKNPQEYLLASFSKEIKKELNFYCNSGKISICCDFLKALRQTHDTCFGFTFDLAKDLERAKHTKEAITIYETIEKGHSYFDASLYEIAHIKYVSLFDEPDSNSASEEDKSLDSEPEDEERAKIRRDLNASNEILSIFFKMGTISEKASQLLRLVCCKRLHINPLKFLSTPSDKKLVGEIETLISKVVGENPINEKDFRIELNQMNIVHLSLLAYRNTTTLNSDSHTDNSDNLISGNKMMDNQASRS